MLATLVNGYDGCAPIYREHTIEILEFWLDTFPSDFHENAIYEQVKKFITEKLGKKKGQDLLDLLLHDTEPLSEIEAEEEELNKIKSMFFELF